MHKQIIFISTNVFKEDNYLWTHYQDFSFLNTAWPIIFILFKFFFFQARVCLTRGIFFTFASYLFLFI